MTTVTKGPLPLAGHWLQSIYTQSLLDKHYPRAQPKPLQQQKGPLQVPDFKVYLRPFRCQIFTRYTPSKHSCQNTCKNKIFKAWCKGTSSLFCQELCSEIQGLCLAFGIVTKELSHEILMVLIHGIGNAHPKFLLAVFLATNVTLLCGTSQKKRRGAKQSKAAAAALVHGSSSSSLAPAARNHCSWKLATHTELWEGPARLETLVTLEPLQPLGGMEQQQAAEQLKAGHTQPWMLVCWEKRKLLQTRGFHPEYSYWVLASGAQIHRSSGLWSQRASSAMSPACTCCLPRVSQGQYQVVGLVLVSCFF